MRCDNPSATDQQNCCDTLVLPLNREPALVEELALQVPGQLPAFTAAAAAAAAADRGLVAT
jgi:hypothetical protein